MNDLTKILDKKHPKLRGSREKTEENTERRERKEWSSIDGPFKVVKERGKLPFYDSADEIVEPFGLASFILFTALTLGSRVLFVSSTLSSYDSSKSFIINERDNRSTKLNKLLLRNCW